MKHHLKNYLEKNEIESEMIGRIVGETRLFYIVKSTEEDYKVYKRPEQQEYFVGDYVHLTLIDNQSYITKLFKRFNQVSKARNQTSKSYNYSGEEKVLATNVDNVYIAIAADQRFTIGKFERYLLVFNQQKVNFEVIITKSDYFEKAQRIQKEIKKYYPLIKIQFLSIFDNSIDQFRKSIFPESTSIILGSSGSGKSTLINHLSKEFQLLTNEVRDDGKGKHTTTDICLIYLKETDSYFIDTPGFKGINSHKELQYENLFDDIIDYSTKCKFNDCKHMKEPGCAVRKAIKSGKLSEEKLIRYHHYLEKEIKRERFLKRRRTSKGN